MCKYIHTVYTYSMFILYIYTHTHTSFLSYTFLYSTNNVSYFFFFCKLFLVLKIQVDLYISFMCQTWPTFFVSVCTCKLLKGYICFYPHIRCFAQLARKSSVLEAVVERVDDGEENKISHGLEVGWNFFLGWWNAFAYIPENYQARRWTYCRLQLHSDTCNAL